MAPASLGPLWHGPCPFLGQRPRRNGKDRVEKDRGEKRGQGERAKKARVEWVGDPVRFTRLDRNADGMVGRWEYGVGWVLDV